MIATAGDGRVADRAIGDGAQAPSPSLSTRTSCFPRNTPRAVQGAVRAALELVDEHGEVVGGMAALQVALGHDSPSATRAVVSQAEGQGLMRRTGPIGHGPRRVFVVEARLNTGACETGCGRAARGRWCPSCRQAHRADREWGHRAVEMAVTGSSPAAIASALSRPLYPDVVFHLFSEVPGLVDPVWLEGLREHSPELVGRLTDRVRQRRAESRRLDARLLP